MTQRNFAPKLFLSDCPARYYKYLNTIFDKKDYILYSGGYKYFQITSHTNLNINPNNAQNLEIKSFGKNPKQPP